MCCVGCIAAAAEWIQNCNPGFSCLLLAHHTACRCCSSGSSSCPHPTRPCSSKLLRTKPTKHTQPTKQGIVLVAACHHCDRQPTLVCCCAGLQERAVFHSCSSAGGASGPACLAWHHPGAQEDEQAHDGLLGRADRPSSQRGTAAGSTRNTRCSGGCVVGLGMDWRAIMGVGSCPAGTKSLDSSLVMVFLS